MEHTHLFKIMDIPLENLHTSLLGGEGPDVPDPNCNRTRASSSGDRDRDSSPGRAPVPRTASLSPHSPKATGNQQLSLQEALLWHKQQQWGITKNSPSAIPKLSHHLLPEAFPHPDPSHGHGPDGLSLTRDSGTGRVALGCHSC